MAEARDGRGAGLELKYRLPRGWIPLQTVSSEVERYLATMDNTRPPDVSMDLKEAVRHPGLQFDTPARTKH